MTCLIGTDAPVHNGRHAVVVSCMCMARQYRLLINNVHDDTKCDAAFSMCELVRVECGPQPQAHKHAALHLHLGQHVAHDFAIIVLSHLQQLWPRENMIEIVLQGRVCCYESGGVLRRNTAVNVHITLLAYLQLIVFW